MKTVYILWLREIKKFFRNRSRVVGSLGQPLLFLLALGYGLGSVFQAAGEGSYIQYLAPGVIGMSIISGSVFNGVSLIWDRQFGFLKETLVAPVPRLYIMLGRTLGGATASMFQGCVVLLVTFFVGLQPTSWLLVLVVVLVMFLIGLLFTAVGLLFGSLLSDFHGFQLIMNFMVMPLFFLSGSLFPLTDAPLVLQIIARCNPLAYGIDAMRALLSGVSHFGLVVDISVLSIVALFFLVVSSYFFSKIQV
jgi:ABC-2 type transport system permease protein